MRCWPSDCIPLVPPDSSLCRLSQAVLGSRAKANSNVPCQGRYRPADPPNWRLWRGAGGLTGVPPRSRTPRLAPPARRGRQSGGSDSAVAPP
eukprot:2945097-Alexandrium_andersonii.AAC.1